MEKNNSDNKTYFKKIYSSLVNEDMLTVLVAQCMFYENIRLKFNYFYDHSAS